MPPAYLRAPGYTGRMRPICRKVGYESREHARLAQRQQRLLGGNALRVYRCPICEGEVWHLGHNRDKAVKAFFRSLESQ